MMKDSNTASKNSALEYDKLQIALAINNSSLKEGLMCSLLLDNSYSSCRECRLERLCNGIDELAAQYKKDTTTIVKEFSFD